MDHTDTTPSTPAAGWQRLQGWRARATATGRQVLEYLRNQLWPVLCRHSQTGASYVRHRVIPVTVQTARRTADGAVSLYQRHAWLQRCGTALNKKAIGLGVAMVAAKLVGAMVETRTLSNLWGLAADKPLVSDATYSVLLFLVEYLVALVVFAVIDYYVIEFRRRRLEQSAP